MVAAEEVRARAAGVTSAALVAEVMKVVGATFAEATVAVMVVAVEEVKARAAEATVAEAVKLMEAEATALTVGAAEDVKVVMMAMAAAEAKLMARAVAVAAVTVAEVVKMISAEATVAVMVVAADGVRSMAAGVRRAAMVAGMVEVTEAKAAEAAVVPVRRPSSWNPAALGRHPRHIPRKRYGGEAVNGWPMVSVGLLAVKARLVAAVLLAGAVDVTEAEVTALTVGAAEGVQW